MTESIEKSAVPDKQSPKKERELPADWEEELRRIARSDDRYYVPMILAYLLFAAAAYAALLAGVVNVIAISLAVASFASALFAFYALVAKRKVS